MSKLYTSKEIAEKYNVKPYTVTNYWGKRGLKHIRGEKNSYLYKTEWVDEYIENHVIQENKEEIEIISIKRPKSKVKKNNNKIQYVV